LTDWEAIWATFAETRSISAENFTGAKGNGGVASEGTGSVPSRKDIDPEIIAESGGDY
jgi:hypothetical protein